MLLEHRDLCTNALYDFGGMGLDLDAIHRVVSKTGRGRLRWQSCLPLHLTAEHVDR